MRPDDPFFLRFRENVHHSLVPLRPVSLGEAVHEANVQVVGPEFLAEAIEIGASLSGIACPSLGKHRDLVTAHVLEPLGHVSMTAVSVRRIKKAQAAVVAV